MIERAARRFPADMLNLTSLVVSIGVAVSLRRVVIVTGFGRPLRGNLRVKGPVRKIKTVNRIGESATFETVGRKPAATIPGVDSVADNALIYLKREHTLRADRRLDFVVRNKRGRAAEVAGLGDALWFEDRDGLAALAFDGTRCRLPTTCAFRNGA